MTSCAPKHEFANDLPEYLRTESELDGLLTRPASALVESIRAVSSPLLLLGAGGKMGPTLAVLARRAAEEARHALEVIAVSRFSNPAARQWLEEKGIKTLALDLLDSRSFEQLPEAGNILYLAGTKFGTEANPSATWAINTIPPSRLSERYPRARIVALSTGNVYPLSEVNRGGSLEADALTPFGEYANAAVARERVFEYYSRRHGTSIALLRLYYAVELRYGVLVDIARQILAGAPVPLATGYFNCIWQGDANEMILRALALTASPPSVWNLCRPEIFSVRAIATRLGELLDRPVTFDGTEAPTALLGNASKLRTRLGQPSLPIDTVLRWTAYWIQHSGRNFGKPTHFEQRDGKY